MAEDGRRAGNRVMGDEARDAVVGHGRRGAVAAVAGLWRAQGAGKDTGADYPDQ